MPTEEENSIEKEFDIISEQGSEDIHSLIAAELEAPIETENAEVSNKKEFKIIEIPETVAQQELAKEVPDTKQALVKPRTRRISRKKAEVAVENNNDDSAKTEEIAI